MRIDDKIGPIAKRVLSSATCPPGDVFVMQLDGRGLPELAKKSTKRPVSRTRRAPRPKQGDGTMTMATSIRNELRERRRPESMKCPSRSSMVCNASIMVGRWSTTNSARMGDREAAMAALARKVSKLEAEPQRLLFLNYSADHDETLHKPYLPQAKHVVDCYHVYEDLWDAAEAIYNGRAQGLVLSAGRKARFSARKVARRTGRAPEARPGHKGLTKDSGLSHCRHRKSSRSHALRRILGRPAGDRLGIYRKYGTAGPRVTVCFQPPLDANSHTPHIKQDISHDQNI